MTETPTSSTPVPVRDNEYYFSFRTFQVGDTLFRLPRHLLLMPNANFKPVSLNKDNDDDLVVLPDDVQKDHFLHLIRAIYPKEFNKPETLTSEAWQHVFQLSDRFHLGDLQKKAANNLKDLYFAGNPVEALICAKKNKLDDWIQPCIDKLVETNQDLTDEDVERLGIGLAMRIAKTQGAAGRR